MLALNKERNILFYIRNWLIFIILGNILIACGIGGASTTTSIKQTNMVTPIATPQSPNLPLYITQTPGNSVCGNPNSACTSVTICHPNQPNNCATVDNVLLDTGSFGLRLFTNNAIDSLNLPIESIFLLPRSRSIATCVTYGDNSANWGPVAIADVVLSGSLAQSVPIQLINTTYIGVESNCASAIPYSSPATFGFNGILGVGPLINDGGRYFSCDTKNCTHISISNRPQLQVSNPIGLFRESAYNNGLTLKFPNIGSSGGYGAIGYAIFGVGTNDDNAINSNINIYPIIPRNSIPITMQTTLFNANSTGFLDTGSNGLFFDSSISSCTTGVANGWYCPNDNQSLYPSNQSKNGTYIPVNINIANAGALFSTGNGAFANLGSLYDGTNRYFDYGLPFFFSKTVYIGFKGKRSIIAPNVESGPFWAF